jgi:hypothetical protein
MALPPLELFSLRKEPPGNQAALFIFGHGGSALARRFRKLFALRIRALPVKSPKESADVAQLVEQLIRNQ